MLTALALSLNISNALTTAVQSKEASLVAGTVFIFMCRKLESKHYAKRRIRLE
jgi:hypothetical protein